MTLNNDSSSTEEEGKGAVVAAGAVGNENDNKEEKDEVPIDQQPEHQSQEEDNDDITNDNKEDMPNAADDDDDDDDKEKKEEEVVHSTNDDEVVPLNEQPITDHQNQEENNDDDNKEDDNKEDNNKEDKPNATGASGDEEDDTEEKEEEVVHSNNNDEVIPLNEQPTTENQNREENDGDMNNNDDNKEDMSNVTRDSDDDDDKEKKEEDSQSNNNDDESTHLNEPTAGDQNQGENSDDDINNDEDKKETPNAAKDSDDDDDDEDGEEKEEVAHENNNDESIHLTERTIDYQNQEEHDDDNINNANDYDKKKEDSMPNLFLIEKLLKEEEEMSEDQLSSEQSSSLLNTILRPERISITITNISVMPLFSSQKSVISITEEVLGCNITMMDEDWNAATAKSLRISKISESGLIATSSSALKNNNSKYNSILEVGDKLLSINDIDCHEQLEMIQKYNSNNTFNDSDHDSARRKIQKLFWDEERMITFVFDTLSKQNNNNNETTMGLHQAVIIQSSSSQENDDNCGDTTTNNSQQQRPKIICQRAAKKKQLQRRGSSKESSSNNNKKQNYLKISTIDCPHLRKYSVLQLNQLVLRIGSISSLLLDPQLANEKVQRKMEKKEKSSSSVLKLTLLTDDDNDVHHSSFADRLKKVAVGVGGSTMLGVGAVMMITPLHPLGQAMAIGGAGLLKYEGSKRVIQSTKSYMPSFLRNRFGHSESQEVSSSYEDVNTMPTACSDWCTPGDSAAAKVKLESVLQQALARRQHLEIKKKNAATTVAFINTNNGSSNSEDTIGNKYERDLKECLELTRQLYYQLEQWRKALQVEEELYQSYYAASSTSNHLVRAQSHNRIGFFHQKLKNFAESHAYFTASLQCFERKIYPTYQYHADIGEAWKFLAGLAVSETRYDVALERLQQKAEPHYRYHGQLKEQEVDTTVEEEQKPMQQPHPELLTCLQNQVRLLQTMNQQDEVARIEDEIEQLSKVLSSSQ